MVYWGHLWNMELGPAGSDQFSRGSKAGGKRGKKGCMVHQYRILKQKDSEFRVVDFKGCKHGQG